MMRYFCLLALLLLACKSKIRLDKSNNTKDYLVHSIAFYNLENLFGLEEDPNTPLAINTIKTKSFYTQEVYQAKQKNMSKVLADIGRELTGTSPTIIGLAEVENFRVLNDLVNQESLRNENYAIIHYDSPDPRGIDVGLLYKKASFIPTHSKTYKLVIYQDLAKTYRKHSRDQLVVSGILEEEKIHLIVNHWPSRIGATATNVLNRRKAAELNRRIIDSLLDIDPKAKIINMGDFNDNPTDPSIKFLMGKQEHPESRELYNPMNALFKRGIGSLAWQDSWNLFDQLHLSREWLHRDPKKLSFYKAEVYNKAYLILQKGKLKGYPYRSYTQEGWTGGYSDHFPVYLYLIKEK